MDRRAVPNHHQLAGDLVPEVLEETHYVFSLEGPILLQHVELALKSYATHRREVSAGEMLMENGCLSHRSVGANHHGQKIEARLIGKHDGSAFLQCLFFREGHFSSFQCSIASSSLWSALRSGFCKLNLNLPNKRLT